MSRDEMVMEVLADSGIHLPEVYITELLDIAEKLRVPARYDCVRNFVAGYLVIRELMSRSAADRLASSARGRRLWEKKIRTLLAGDKDGK